MPGRSRPGGEESEVQPTNRTEEMRMDLRRAVPRTFEEAAEGGRAGPDSTGLDTGMLLLRLVVGWTMAVHGAQKLLGWFGGPGFTGTARFLEHMGFRPGELHAVLSGGAELG